MKDDALKFTDSALPCRGATCGLPFATARALAVEPQLILYDEPTGELDPVSAVSIAEDIVKLNERIHATTLVVSHDRDLAFGIAHRIAMLDEGRIVAIGTPDEVKCNLNPACSIF